MVIRALLGALLALTSCTDVQENFPEGGCVPDTLKCVGGDLAKCREDGSGFDLFKECAADSPCAGNPPDCEAAVVDVPGCENDQQCIEQLDIGGCKEAFCDTDGTCRIRNLADGTTCDDGSACTEETTCAEGTCIGTPIACEDDNPCTSSACDPAQGCVTTNIDGGQCNDSNLCTTGDTCVNGSCQGVELNCDDTNPCTGDFCDAESGKCEHTAITGACDDGDPCTAEDMCGNGVCTGNPICLCDDQDTCDQYQTGNPCTGEYVCEEGFCVIDPTTTFECPQTGAGVCEINQCVNDNGTATCQLINLPDNGPCDDGSVCTYGDVCLGGACVGTLDPTVPGCTYFRLRAWFFIPSSRDASIPGQSLQGAAGYPQIIGTASGPDYKVRAAGPRL